MKPQSPCFDIVSTCTFHWEHFLVSGLPCERLRCIFASKGMCNQCTENKKAKKIRDFFLLSKLYSAILSSAHFCPFLTFLKIDTIVHLVRHSLLLRMLGYKYMQIKCLHSSKIGLSAVNRDFNTISIPRVD